jgi:hypothetical protein
MGFQDKTGFAAMTRREKKILSLGPAAGSLVTFEIPAAVPRRPPRNGINSNREYRCAFFF